MLNDIEEMRQEPVKHKAVVIPDIQNEYYLFVVDTKEENTFEPLRNIINLKSEVLFENKIWKQ